MPDTDLSGFESRLRSALVHEAATMDVAPDLPSRVRARAHRRRGSRRVAIGAFVAAIVVLAAVAVALPRAGRPTSTPAAPVSPASPAWPRVGTLRPSPGSPVEDLATAGYGVLYGTVRRGALTVAVRSLDGGVTWAVTGDAPCGQGAVAGLAFSDPMHGVAACPSSYVVTTNGGATWVRATALGQPGETPAQPTGTMSPLAGGHGSIWAITWRCTPSTPGQACQESIASSTDGGASWSTSTLTLGSEGVARGYSPGSLASLQITGPQSGYLLSGGNVMFATTDGWRTWTTSAVPCGGGQFFGSSQLAAAAPSVLYLWCANGTRTGWDLALSRSTDGGRTWHLRSTDFPAAKGPPDPELLAVFAPASSSTLVLQDSGALIRSDDGGATWHVTPGLRATWVHFSDSRHGVLLDEATGAGADFGWWTTSDAGATWHHTSSP